MAVQSPYLHCSLILSVNSPNLQTLVILPNLVFIVLALTGGNYDFIVPSKLTLPKYLMQLM